MANRRNVQESVQGQLVSAVSGRFVEIVAERYQRIAAGQSQASSNNGSYCGVVKITSFDLTDFVLKNNHNHYI